MGWIKKSNIMELKNGILSAHPHTMHIPYVLANGHVSSFSVSFTSGYYLRVV